MEILASAGAAIARDVWQNRIFQSDFSRMENLRMLLDVILIGGMTVAFGLTVILLKTRKRLTYRLPAVFFILCFFFLLYYYAFLHRSAILGAVALFFGNGMGLLLGPVLYFYVKSITYPASRLSRSLWPALLSYGIFWLFVSIPLAADVLQWGNLGVYASILQQNADYLNLSENAVLLYYCLITLQLTKRLNALYDQNYSAPEHKNIAWTKKLIWGLIAVVAVDSVLSVYELLYPPQVVVWNIGLVVALMLVAHTGYLGYRGLFQAQILLPEFLLTEPQQAQDKDNDIAAPASAARLASLDPAELRELCDRLDDLLKTERVYLEENLTLGDLAQRLDLTDKKLSELLNKVLRTNFYTLINEYRIAHAQKLLADPAFGHYSLAGIGLESGFNSKTSFNRD